MSEESNMIARDMERQINVTTAVKDRRSFAVEGLRQRRSISEVHGWVLVCLLKWCKHCSLTSEVKRYCCIKA